MEKNGKSNLTIKVIAIAGPTGSGKTKLADRLLKIIGEDACLVISQDSYYKERPGLSRKERKKINFDDFKSFDWALLLKHLMYLKKGIPVLMPVYDFVQSQRLKKTQRIKPKQFIVVEGLTPFFDKKLRSLFDYRIYIEVSNVICLARRIRRDTKERGESIESVFHRYFNDVLPMQKKYVEPQKKWADLIIDG